MAKTLTSNILGPVREGPCRRQILSGIYEARVFPMLPTWEPPARVRDVFKSGKFVTGVGS